MITYLADSSAWIDFIRRPDSSLRRYVEDNTAGHTEVVAMELLSGTVTERDSVDVERLLLRSPLLAFDSTSDFLAATDLRRAALRNGLRVGVVDCMILAVAGRYDVPLITKDRPQAALGSALGVKTLVLGL